MTNATRWTTKLALAALAAALTAAGASAQDSGKEGRADGAEQSAKRSPEGKGDAKQEAWEEYLRKEKLLREELERKLFCKKHPGKCKDLKPNKPPKPLHKCPGFKAGEAEQKASKCVGKAGRAGSAIAKARKEAGGELKPAPQAPEVGPSGPVDGPAEPAPLRKAAEAIEDSDE